MIPILFGSSGVAAFLRVLLTRPPHRRRETAYLPVQQGRPRFQKSLLRGGATDRDLGDAIISFVDRKERGHRINEPDFAPPSTSPSPSSPSVNGSVLAIVPLRK